MRNNRSRFDNPWLFYLGEPAAPCRVGELRYLQLTRGVSLTYAQSWIESGFRLSEDLPLSANEASAREPARAVGAVDDARPDRWGERVIQFVDRPEIGTGTVSSFSPRSPRESSRRCGARQK